MKAIHLLALGLVMTACGTLPVQPAEPTPTAEKTVQTAIPTITTAPLVTNTVVPVSLTEIPETAFLFQEDMEGGFPEGVPAEFADWEIRPENDENHMLCNRSSQFGEIAYLGHMDWENYAIELRVRAVEVGDDSYVSVSARFDPYEYVGYYGALNFSVNQADLAYNDPYTNYANQSYRADPDTWYRLRLEAAGDQLRYYIDDELIGSGTGTQRSNGKASFGTIPGLTICVDDVRVWALKEDGTVDPQPETVHPYPATLEITSIYADVWSGNMPGGQTYEFKVNCNGDYSSLETCFLWDLEAVKVTTPSGKVYELEKDFNIQSYSGETTRRWVLYGQPGEGLPESGAHLFTFYRDGQPVLYREVPYTLSVVPMITQVKASQEGKDLRVTWEPPASWTSDMSYKVIVYRSNTWEGVASMSYWETSDVVLEAPPFTAGEGYRVTVALYESNGYSSSEDVYFTWKAQ
jgi:hypothetical protein